MYKVKTKAKNIKDWFNIFVAPNTGHYIFQPTSNTIKCKICVKYSNEKFFEYGLKIPNQYIQHPWFEDAITVEFEDEEIALYYQLKWGE